MLKQLLISEVRIRMLALFLVETPFGSPLHVREIARNLDAEINAVRRELDNLLKIHMLKREEKGNRVYYSINPTFPLIDELTGLLVKEQGIGRVLIDNKSKVGKVNFAIVSKELLRGRVAKSNEVDVFLVGDVDIKILGEILKSEQERFGHDINYTAMTLAEFDMRKARNDSFIKEIFVQPYIMVIGDSVAFTH